MALLQSALTARAEVGSTASKENAADGGSAAAAGFAGAQVDAMLKLKEPAGSVGVDIIGDRRAAQPDGMLQDLSESLAQTLELGTGETAGGAAGTNAGMEEAFVGIDIAHPSEEGLVEQGGLDWELAASEESGKVFGGDGERFGAGRSKGRGPTRVAEVPFPELQAPEAAGIDEAQFAATQKA